MKYNAKQISAFQKQVAKALKNEQENPALKDSLLQLSKELIAYKKFMISKQKSLSSLDKHKMLNKLQVGGGKEYLEGFINLDLFEPADIIWDCRFGLPFEDNRFSYIFSEHFLEHLDYPNSAKTVLENFYRTLQPKGELFISIPDAGKIIEAYSQKNTKYLKYLYQECFSKRTPQAVINGNIDYINYIFRDQIENPKYTIHKWAYDFESIKNLLKSIGFKKITKTTINKEYCNKEREFYSLYITAIK